MSVTIGSLFVMINLIVVIALVASPIVFFSVFTDFDQFLGNISPIDEPKNSNNINIVPKKKFNELLDLNIVF